MGKRSSKKAGCNVCVCKTPTPPTSSARWGFSSSWAAGTASFSSPVGVILAIWRRRGGRCEECQRAEVEWSGCHGEHALFHQAGLWLAGAEAEGRKFCQLETIDVLLPGQAVLTQSWHLLATRLLLRFEKVTLNKKKGLTNTAICAAVWTDRGFFSWIKWQSNMSGGSILIFYLSKSINITT